MNNFIFENKTKVFFGEGCVKEYLACLSGRYGENVLLCYGGGSIRENGIYDQVMESMRKAGKHVTELSGIMPNPTYEKVLEGAKLARESRTDLILGVGGGSVMDCCKAISMAAVYEGDVWEDFFERPGIVDFEPLPVGVVVTVAGTGSEMNGGAVITNGEKKIKTGRDYPGCNPVFALMDPTYTYSVPKRRMVSNWENRRISSVIRWNTSLALTRTATTGRLWRISSGRSACLPRCGRWAWEKI